MSRIGLLTMHRPINYGSALQAWATQIILSKLGHDVTIIDYIYPNEIHKSKGSKIKSFLRRINAWRLGNPWKKKKQKFYEFWKDNYKMTISYPTKESIFSNPPVFDIYVVGSDQVWNPTMIVGDDTFLLSFAPNDALLLSYASSFAKHTIPASLVDIYKQNLNRFVSISVRERSGVELVKSLINKNAELCLDPTLLLTHDDYKELIEKSLIRIDKPYILVYMLDYAFNPYPYAVDFVKAAHRQTGLHIVCIDFSSRYPLGIKDMTHLYDAISPQDFLWLMENASFVITSSFHGTAFALNFNKSVYSIISEKDSEDDRIKSLLESVGLGKCIFCKGDRIPNFTTSSLPDFVSKRLDDLRQFSIQYLKDNV